MCTRHCTRRGIDDGTGNDFAPHSCICIHMSLSRWHHAIRQTYGGIHTHAPWNTTVKRWNPCFICCITKELAATYLGHPVSVHIIGTGDVTDASPANALRFSARPRNEQLVDLCVILKPSLTFKLPYISRQLTTLCTAREDPQPPHNLYRCQVPQALCAWAAQGRHGVPWYTPKSWAEYNIYSNCWHDCGAWRPPKRMGSTAAKNAIGVHQGT